jgi:hypothetical protein
MNTGTNLYLSIVLLSFTAIYLQHLPLNRFSTSQSCPLHIVPIIQHQLKILCVEEEEKAVCVALIYTIDDRKNCL